MKKQKAILKEMFSAELFILGFAIATLIFFVSSIIVLASDSTQMTQSITGSLDVQIVDGSGNTVASPGIAFPVKSFAMSHQTSSATLGTASEKLRVTNPSGTTDIWTLSIAATNGATAVWTNGTNSYDFNDPTANAGDGADADSVGGQMTIDPSVGTIAGVGGTSTSNVSKGSIFSFAEGSKDSIDLMSASAGAAKPGQWDLTGVAISQTIPGGQAVGSYSIDMTLTVI